ncbi:MAG: DUF4179 domain-containing protein [Firmicutes bacterium]|nr:DUF4179 domain-containing protein [Bacillota bacterium]
MSSRLDDLGVSVDLKFDTERIKVLTNKRLNAEPTERQIFMKHKKIKIALIAALITFLGFASAYAGGSIISYFQSNKAVEMTDIEELEKYSEEINMSISQDGYTLTLNNLAIDDNFMHVFYTITSQDGRIWENENLRPFIICRINGYLADNSDTYGYYVDDYTYKRAEKYDISQMNIPDDFTFEMYSAPRYEDLPDFEEGYLYREYLELTEDDKAKLAYLSLETKKSTEANILYEPNQHFKFTDFEGGDAVGEISKVVISPFGSQFIVTDSLGGLGARRVLDMAMQDDNGEFLDILISSLTGAAADENGYFIDILSETVEANTEYQNTIEFIKGNSDMKYFTLIPTKEDHGGNGSITQEIGEYPLTYEINEYGKIIVTGIVITDGEIDVHYYKDGYVRGNPEFVFLDENENEIKLGNMPSEDYRVHYDTNSYTFSYSYFDFDDSGRMPLPSDGSLSRESLEQRLTSLTVIADSDYTLDYDNAVRVELN